MTHAELKQKIITKFGSIRRFAAIKKLSHYEVRKFLIRRDNNLTETKQNEIDDFEKIVDRTRANQTPPNEISKTDRTAIRRVIDLGFGNVRNFCKEYPEFQVVTVYQILDGTRKRKTKIVTELINTLEQCKFNKETKVLGVAEQDNPAGNI